MICVQKSKGKQTETKENKDLGNWCGSHPLVKITLRGWAYCIINNNVYIGNLAMMVVKLKR